MELAISVSGLGNQSIVRKLSLGAGFADDGWDAQIDGTVRVPRKHGSQVETKPADGHLGVPETQVIDDVSADGSIGRVQRVSGAAVVRKRRVRLPVIM